MPKTHRMPLSIDMGRYRDLPPDLRVRFDCWLESEGLKDQMIVKFRLGEGVIVAERLQLEADGRPVLNADRTEVVLERHEYPVRSLPPKEALS